MSQLDDAVTRYNKLLENGPLSDLAWAEALHERMESGKLSAGNSSRRASKVGLASTICSIRSIAEIRDSPVFTSESYCRREMKLGRRKGQIRRPPAESLEVSMRSCRASAQARSLDGPVSNNLLYLVTASSNWDMLS